jgi:hypothetical protein
VEAPQRPALQEVSQFMLLEREVEIQYRPRMREALQNKVNTVADSLRDQTPACSGCLEARPTHGATGSHTALGCSAERKTDWVALT